jgi:hypothetical protein
VRHGESVRNEGAPQDVPSSNGYGPYGILAVCHINLWPAVRMELGQEGWLKQLVAKVRGPIMAGDQGSHWGHHCSKTALTCNPISKMRVAPPGHETLPLWREVNGKSTGPVRHGESVRNAGAPQYLHSVCVESIYVYTV